MRHLVFFVAIILAGHCLAGDDGFKPLITGPDFEGFKIMQRNATEDQADRVYCYRPDGGIHLFRDLPDRTGVETNQNGTHGILYTTKTYRRYHLKFEYQWGEKLFNNHEKFQYDSGLIYHIEKLKIWPTALQYQIRLNHLRDKNHTGDFVAGGIAMQWYSKDGKTFEMPSKGGKPQPIRRGQHFAHADANFHGLGDHWNQCEIIVMGDRWAIHKLNGDVVNFATNLGVAEGAIALEAETAEIVWRNIMIKEFDTDLPVGEFADGLTDSFTDEQSSAAIGD